LPTPVAFPFPLPCVGDGDGLGDVALTLLVDVDPPDVDEPALVDVLDDEAVPDVVGVVDEPVDDVLPPPVPGYVVTTGAVPAPVAAPDACATGTTTWAAARGVDSGVPASVVADSQRRPRAINAASSTELTRATAAEAESTPPRVRIADIPHVSDSSRYVGRSRPVLLRRSGDRSMVRAASSARCGHRGERCGEAFQAA
jgi:hypothetical protein